MRIFPAIDLQSGKAVRLFQGKRDKVTIFGNPLQMAEKWRGNGAEWLHIIDLDGAFDGDSQNIGIIEEICANNAMKVQVGGGIRSLERCKRYLDAGVERLIIGTVALENPGLFSEMCREFPGKIGVSLDAENGRLKSRGWLTDSGRDVHGILPAMAGAAFIIYTDIERDGTQSGPNLSALAALLKATDIPIIAAGGIAGIKDIKDIYALHPLGNLEGVISGRAIYENTLDLQEAIGWLRTQEAISE